MTDIPSRDPANENTLVGMLNNELRKHAVRTADMLPARVIAFNRATNRVQVQPLIKVVSTSGQTHSRAQIASLPVLQLGGGGFLISCNVQTGDLGWIKANDRDISLFLQTYAEAQPNTARLHDFADAVFIPDAMTGFSVPGADASSLNIQNDAGTIRLSISSTYVQLVAGSNSVRVTAAGITSSGAWAHTGTLTANGVDVGSTHKHTGGTISGETGVPIP